MSVCFEEPTIDELLGDGLTQSLMQADRVDVAALRVMLREVTSSRKAAFAESDRIKGRGDPSWIPKAWAAERSHRSWAVAANPT
ncbi:hypothetical protein [Bradyrhizobium acaciae]|uniref:hypothetical protein n=1 Tax=Bradyrhizobium acaciae TaxID=2683706 RepID=UPI001E5C472D|nr:hypothetical protein [Bradyrhizobium acaciae]MCC8977346.1 hypothetical protein [Bradyrhizobium acaciae]